MIAVHHDLVYHSVRSQDLEGAIPLLCNVENLSKLDVAPYFGPSRIGPPLKDV
jgi:hypothetical protein